MITDNRQITTSNGQCPDYGKLEALANGTLTPEESASIQKHLDTCADCKEIYDAIKEADADFVEAALLEINDRIDKRAAAIDGSQAVSGGEPSQTDAPKGRIVKLVARYAAAAAIAGFCIWSASQYIHRDNDGGNVADDIEQHSAPQDGMLHEQTDAVVAEQPDNSAAVKPDAGATQQGKAADAEVKTETPAEVTGQKPAPKQPEKKTTPSDNKPSQGKVAEDKPQKTDNVTKTDDLQDEFEAGTVTRGISITKPGTEKVVNTDKVEKLMVDAVRFYDEGNYTVAKAVLERIVDEDPGNNDAVKKLALCDFYLHNYGQSLKNLRRVVPKDEKERREIEGYIDECFKHMNY